jgi:type I restriction enzyme S subunit
MLSGNAWSASKFKDEGIIPIIRIQNLGNNENEKFIWWNDDYDKKFVVKKGDLLLSLSGSIKIDIWKGIDALLNQRIVKLIPKNGIDPQWFYWQITNIILDIERMGKWALVNNVSITDLKDLEIPLPPLPIQKRIAEILDAADALKRKDQALLKKYDELAQAIFIDMFGDPVKNEKGWEVKKLKDICIKITDGTHFSPPNQPSGIPYITAKHLKQDVVDFYCNPTYISQKDHEEIFSRCTPVQSDVLYIKDGATTGVAAVNEYDFEFSMLSSLALIKPNKTLLNSYYLSCFLNNDIVKQELIRSYMAGAAIKRFTLDKINKFEIMLPPIELQNSFETKWKKLRQSILHVKDSRSNDLFQTLIQKAFKGELVNE